MSDIVLRCDTDGLYLESIVKRQWWEFWKPKVYCRTHVSKAINIPAGTRLGLSREQGKYVARVNGKPVMEWNG